MTVHMVMLEGGLEAALRASEERLRHIVEPAGPHLGVIAAA
jgi:hypothetical protein